MTTTVMTELADADEVGMPATLDPNHTPALNRPPSKPLNSNTSTGETGTVRRLAKTVRSMITMTSSGGIKAARTKISQGTSPGDCDSDRPSARKMTEANTALMAQARHEMAHLPPSRSAVVRCDSMSVSALAHGAGCLEVNLS